MQIGKTEYLASVEQQGLWFEMLQGVVHVAPQRIERAYHLPSEIDPTDLASAVRTVFMRTPILRAAFIQRDTALYFAPGVCEPHVWNADEITSVETRHEYLEISLDDLRRGALAKAVISRTGGSGPCLLELSISHLVCDATSMNLIEVSIERTLASGPVGNDPLDQDASPESTEGLLSYGCDQRTWLQTTEARSMREFWMRQAQMINAASPVPAGGFAKGNRQGAAWAESVSLDATVTAGFRQSAARYSVTPHVLLLGLLFILHARYSSSRTVAIATAIDRRPLIEGGGQIGLAADMMCLPFEVSADEPLTAFLTRLSDCFFTALEAVRLPFASWAGIAGVAGHVSTCLEFIDGRRGDSLLRRMPTRSDAVDHSLVIKADLSVTTTLELMGDVSAYESAGDLCRVARRLATAFRAIATGAHGDSRLRDIPFSTDAEFSQLLAIAHRHDAPMAAGTLVDEFKAVAARHPDAVAVIATSAVWTFRELQDAAFRVAQWIDRSSVADRQLRVAIVVDRSPQMLSLLLGIMMARGIYIPVSQYNRDERIHKQLEDSEADLVICDAHYVKRLERTCRIPVFAWGALPDLGESMSEPRHPAPSDLAYIIYTSGSSGEPKGVCVSHDAISRTVRFRARYYDFSEKDRILQVPAVFYDSAVNDYFSTWLGAAALVMLDERERTDVNRMARLIEQHQVTHFMMVPAMYRLLMGTLVGSWSALRQVVLCGDDLNQNLVGEHRRRLPHVDLFNEYGPAETAVWTTVHQIVADDAQVLIGAPIADHIVDLIDDEWGVREIGEPGEICVSGPGLAAGYTGDASYTDRKFVAHPLRQQRMYRTGDRAVRVANGALKFLGRVDRMIKIAGANVDVEAIEQLLLGSPGVEQAMVVPLVPAGSDEGPIGTVAFVSSTTPLDAQALLDQLRAQLSGVATPRYVQVCTDLPLTINGKIDQAELRRRAATLHTTPSLPDSLGQPASEPAAVSQSARLDAIWSETIGSPPQLGVSVFDLGGNSLMVMHLTSRVNAELKLSLSIADVYRNPTLDGLHALVQQQWTTPTKRVQTVADLWREADISRRLFVRAIVSKVKQAFNVLDVWELDVPLDVARLAGAVDQVVSELPVLRTGLELRHGDMARVPYSALLDNPLFYKDLDDGELPAELEALLCKPFDLSRPPLFRIGLYRGSASQTWLALVIHHVIADGESIHLIASRILQCYEGMHNARPVRPSGNLISALASADESRHYWKAALAECKPLDLPVRLSARKQRTHVGQVLTRIFDSLSTEVITQLAANARLSQYALLGALFAVTLSRFVAMKKVSFGMPLNVRDAVDARGKVGCFVNPVVVTTTVDPQLGPAGFLSHFREVFARTWSHGFFPFDQLLVENDVKAERGRHHCFDVGLTLDEPLGAINSNALTMRQIGFNPRQPAAPHDFWVYFKVDGERVAADVLFDTSLYTEAQLDGFLGDFEQIALQFRDEFDEPGVLLTHSTQDREVSHDL
ncbi:amino acid adenylation domain-containing protein [Paraburkholderia sp. SIMBA_027]|uniref:amino acid adenylation domain-containing protein n=1 Tax=Paraburkholderia sp. SIMBA_027 TaxID=3085770 RepID=UPI00397C5856